jgi:hypothetical protein
MSGDGWAGDTIKSTQSGNINANAKVTDARFYRARAGVPQG